MKHAPNTEFLANILAQHRSKNDARFHCHRLCHPRAEHGGSSYIFLTVEVSHVW